MLSIVRVDPALKTLKSLAMNNARDQVISAEIDWPRRRLVGAAAASLITGSVGLSGTSAMASAGSKPSPSAGTSGAAGCPALLQHSFPRLQDEASVSLCGFAGKVVLVVNTASLCGYTSQYEGLERLYGRFEKRGLVILGFPSNDFGQQEPGGSSQIGEVCFNTYGVRFPMFAKTVVIGPNANAFYGQLAQVTGEAPRWNFHKYLIDRGGKPVASYPSRVVPESRELVAAIERALGNG
jgi:glutathione peroxidase